jgi:tRNA-Thr(GGU) m(6)t(6)A37 methyltransferase TsaA
MAKRSGRHLLPKYTLPAGMTLAVEPIGVVHSPFQWRDQAPRQANVGEAVAATIVLKPGMQNTLQDLAGFDYCWVLFWFSYSKGWKHQIVPPRDTVKRGIFATRSPDRPNAIGLSAVRITAIRGPRITISGCDILNGSPVLDLKPYVPAYDAFPGAKAGWVDALTAPGPDHRYR